MPAQNIVTLGELTTYNTFQIVFYARGILVRKVAMPSFHAKDLQRLAFIKSGDFYLC